MKMPFLTLRVAPDSRNAWKIDRVPHFATRNQMNLGSHPMVTLYRFGEGKNVQLASRLAHA